MQTQQGVPASRCKVPGLNPTAELAWWGLQLLRVLLRCGGHGTHERGGGLAFTSAARLNAALTVCKHEGASALPGLRVTGRVENGGFPT